MRQNRRNLFAQRPRRAVFKSAATTTLAVVMIALTPLLGTGRASACWSGDVSLAKQMESTDLWGVIEVTGISYAGPGDFVRTYVEYNFVDQSGKAIRVAEKLSYEGGQLPDGTRIVPSTSPKMEVGKYYVVLLKKGDNGYEPTLQALSVIKVLADEKNLSSNAPVTLDEVHGLVLPGKDQPVRSASLGEVVAALSKLRAAIPSAQGVQP